jgi:hypothetical protein
MLAFDIETEGLKKSIHCITMACVYDPDRGIELSFNLKEVGPIHTHTPLPAPSPTPPSHTADRTPRPLNGVQALITK